MMTQDANLWVDQCRRCQVAKGDYNTPKPKFGHLIAHNPLDLVCLDFTKVDPSKGGKENVLVMTDAFTKFSVAVTTNNQQALTVAKALVERWFHIYGIPSRIHSDQGKSFDNKIVDALCKMYGVERTMTSPYNPRVNSQCERFNRTMFGLLKTLTKEQKGDWPSHLPVLTFAYNPTPHSTTGYQPYELMFGRKAPAPCDNWLGLRQYNDDKSISKVVWVDKQFEKIVQANKQVLKSIQARAKVNERSSGDKDFDIPIGNLVLLHDHPEGRNKIQDDYKLDLFEVTGKHSDPNAFFVKPLDGKGPVKQVNRRQMFDLGVTERERREGESDQIEEDPEVPKAPVYHPRVKIATKPQGHQYHLRSKGPVPIPAPRVSHVRSQGVKLDQSPVASELLECSRL